MVEQLRREAAIKRINVSQAIEDIKVCIVRNYVQPQAGPRPRPNTVRCSSTTTWGREWTSLSVISHFFSSFSFIYFDRSSYLIMEMRTTYWWNFLLKYWIHSEKNGLAASSNNAVRCSSTRTWGREWTSLSLISQFFFLPSLLHATTEVHIWSWKRGLPTGGISFSKIESIQRKIVL